MASKAWQRTISLGCSRQYLPENLRDDISLHVCLHLMSSQEAKGFLAPQWKATGCIGGAGRSNISEEVQADGEE